jgi:hypothetical protein
MMMIVKKMSLLLTIILLLSACSSGRLYYAKGGVPRFWTWLDYKATVNYDSLLSLYAAHGVRGITLNAGGNMEVFRKVIPIADKYHVKVFAWIFGTCQGALAAQHPEWLDYNAQGKSLAQQKAYVDFYKFINPAIPGFREELQKQVEAICQIKGLKGISLDYTRYVDAILPEGIQPRYGIHQDKVYPEWDYGYHPVAIEKFKKQYGYDPRAEANPSQDSLWFQFRLRQVVECVLPLVEIAHRHGKQITASPFPTPAMSRRMVMQDWDKWNLDFYQPMIYYGFYNEDYVWMGACTKEDVAAVGPNKIISAILVDDVTGSKTDPKKVIKTAMDNGSSGLAFFGRPTIAFLEAIKTYKK